MASFCTKCGSPLKEGAAFCGKCGTRVNLPVTAPASANPATPPVPQVSAAAPTLPQPTEAASPASPTIPAAPGLTPARVPTAVAPAGASAPAVPAPKKPGSLLLKIVLVVIGLFALVSVLVIGSCVYIGYRIKQKAVEIEQAAGVNNEAPPSQATTGKGPSNQPGSSSQGGQAGQNSGAGSGLQNLVGAGAEAIMRKAMGAGPAAGGPPPKLPEWKAAPPELVSSPASKIPLRVSLRIVVTGTESSRGDYDSIFLVDSVTSKQIHITGHQEFPHPSSGLSLTSSPSEKEAVKIDCSQTERKIDLENAVQTSPYFCKQGEDDIFPGTTCLSFSRNVFADLKASKDTHFVTHEDPMDAFVKSFGDLASGSGNATDFLNRMMSVAPGSTPPPSPPIPVTLRRVGPDIAFPVLVNNQPAQLPALHITGTASGSANHGDVYVLDDPDLPLIVAARGFGGTGQITAISWNSGAPGAGASGGGGGGAGAGGGGGGGGGAAAGARQLEQELEKTGRAKIYDIYFDFASATLRPESKKVLDEISIVMRDHPDWKLGVEGNTDNIGGDAYNLDLSKRRAAAVKQALVSGYHVDSGRLTTAGFGDTHPVASNDTIEGRALNRRVELARQ